MHTSSELVDDPVSHISISGIHGRAELDDRLDWNGEQYDGYNSNGLGRLVAGALIGAAVMYLFDPGRGTRRRALIRDKFVRAGHSTADRLGKVKRDARNRAVGAVAEARTHFRRERVDDTILIERVRSAIGHVVSHPGSIVVTAMDGEINLSGPVLAHEVEKLVSAAGSVRGVRCVNNLLDAHESAEGIPGLQSDSA